MPGASILLLLLLGTPRIAGSAQDVHPWGREASSWHAEPRATALGPLTALAVEPLPGTRLAVAGEEGVWWAAAGEAFRPVLRSGRSGAVRDLAFAPDGSLWVAAERGLFRADREGPVEARGVEPGERGRSIQRLSRSKDHWAVATDAGVRTSLDARRWSRPAGLPALPARAVVDAGDDGLWALLGDDLWRIGPDGESLRIPGLGGRALVDLTLRSDGRPVALLADGLASPEPQRPDAAWRFVGGLPPGVDVHRIAVGAGHWWVASDQGILTSTRWDGPWSRAPGSERTGAIRALAFRGALAFAAGERGLWVRGPAEGIPPARRPLPELPLEPALEPVRRAALAYLDLGPVRLRRLERDASRRGWLPSLTLRFGRDTSFQRRSNRDQSFVSGDVRPLFDRDRERRRGFDASLTATWDLADALHDPEEVDVSREVRELIELRDQVLDEIHQLYFERRRVLLQLLTLDADATPLEAARLRLRADELAAGIDAWTGGWFGRHTKTWSR